MQLARRFHLDVLKLVANLHPEWPFEDRVLVWLLPNMERESLAFHNAAGLDMASLFVGHQLEHFDEVLAKELARRLDR